MLQDMLNISDHFKKSIFLILIMKNKHWSSSFPEENKKNQSKTEISLRNINLMEVILVTKDM